MSILPHSGFTRSHPRYFSLLTTRDASVLEAQPKTIEIDPLISFGRPTLAGTGIPTNVIAGRFAAGERTGPIARDYGIEEAQVKEALRYEGALQKAA